VIRCELSKSLLTAAVLAGEEPGWPIGSHSAHCIKCQAHVASLRATRRRLSEMGKDRVETPPGFQVQVLDRLNEGAEFPDGSNGRWVRAAGASMAAALLAAVWARRRALARV
jgi:hypothetical protein